MQTIPDVVSRKEFTRGGFPVLEVVAPWWDAGRKFFKLIWVRLPVESVRPDGKPNRFFDEDLPTLLDCEASRSRVAAAFDAYWGVEGEALP